MKTRRTSPGRTTGFRELASSLMFSTATPRSCATLLRLKSLVTILPLIRRASSISFRSTSRISGKSVSTICTCTLPIFWTFCRMSRPRRPRLRFRESEESATCCSSRRTNWGTTRVPSRKPVSQMSAMRPSMMTEVSRTLYWWRRVESLKAAMMREGSHQVVGRDAAELDLEGYDGKGRQDAEPGPHQGLAGHRGVEVSRMGEEGDHEDAEEAEPHGRTFRDPRWEPPEHNETRT